MMVFTVDRIRAISIKAFMATGCGEQEAAVIAEELVQASLMGFDSHGFPRIADYLPLVQNGTILPGAPVEVAYETPVSIVVDGHQNYGIITAGETTRRVIDKARQSGLAMGATRHCNHIGRLGAYTQKIADAGMVGLGVVNSSRHGHFVAPFGGAEGRLATNPLSYAFPTKGDPIVLDMSTSMISEGKIRLTLQEGKRLPEQCVLTYDGKPTTDPQAFYEPQKGTILPFGGDMGYKGFGLALLVELMGSTLSGVPLTPPGEKDAYVNGLSLIAIEPGIFGPSNDLLENVESLRSYIKSARPSGSKGVIMPGELEFETRRRRLQEGIPVAEETWQLILKAGKAFGVDLEQVL